MYVLKPDVHAPVCDLGMVGSSHTVSIDFVSPSCPIFLVRAAVSLRDVWWDEG